MPSIAATNLASVKVQKSSSSRFFILSLARITALEGLRARLPWLMAAISLVALSLSYFLTQVSLLEAGEIRSTVIAACLRCAAVFVMVIFVTGSIGREAADKFMDLLLSQPAPRWAYYAGKQLGYFLVAGFIATAFSLLLWVIAQRPGVLTWGYSLLCELAIMSSLSLFFALSFSQTVTAISAAVGFYLLARSMNILQLMASASLQSQQTSAADQLIAGFVHVTALVLPSLDRFTQSSWLVSPPDASVLLFLSAQAMVYVALLAFASIFDLCRKNF